MWIISRLAAAPGGQDPNTVIGVDSQGLTSSEQMLRKYLMDRTERRMRVDETPSLESNPRARIKQAGCSTVVSRLREQRGLCYLVSFWLLPSVPSPCSLPHLTIRLLGRDGAAWGDWEEAGLEGVLSPGALARKGQLGKCGHREGRGSWPCGRWAGR